MCIRDRYMMFCLYMKLRTYLNDETISVTTKASFSVFQCLVTCVELVHKYWQQNTVMRSKGAACNLWWAKLGENLELGHCHNEIQGRSPQKLTHLLQSRKVFSSGMRLWSSHYFAVYTEHQWSVSRRRHWSSQIYILACIDCLETLIVSNL